MGTREDFAPQLDAIRSRRTELHEEYLDLIRGSVNMSRDEIERSHVRMMEIDAERDELSEQSDAIYSEWDEERRYQLDGFFRPNGGIATLLNKPLGALPKRALVIDPTKEALNEVKSYRVQAFFTLAGAIALILFLFNQVEWMRVSPMSLLFAVTTSVFGPGLFSTAIGVLLALWIFRYVAFAIKNHPSQGGFWANAAMLEEQWFRMGAENWSWPRRIYSCIAFGLVHVVNIIYPIASLLVVGLAGGVMMAVYLAEYRRSGDTRRATLASAKFHATYNRFAIAYMVVALGLTLAYSVMM